MSILKAAALLAVLGWAGALSVFDLVWRRLPNTLTIGGAAVTLAGAAAVGRGWPALLGSIALAGLYLTVHLADPAAMGAGDVKLALAVGGLTGALGPAVWAVAALGAPLLTATAGVVALTLRPTGRSSAPGLPHGPSMCTASLAAAALAVL